MNDNEAFNSKEELVRKILQNDEDLENCNINEDLIHQLICGKVARNMIETHDEELTLGQKAADKIAAFGGSWPFIIIFCITLVSWIVLNIVILKSKPFDPYPFILLNLVLSCLSAIQAPIIMMSQNRQTEKDRMTAANDYLVNLKSEIVVEDLHKKIDVLLEQHEESKKIQELLLKEIEELKNRK